MVEVSATRVEGFADIGPAQHQPHGIVHGGVWATIVETVGSFGAQCFASERGLQVVGVHNSTDFLRPLRSGRVSVVAEPVHQGRTMQLWEVSIRDSEGRMVALGKLRLQHLEPRPD